MLSITPITPEKVQIFYKDNENYILLGEANEYEFNDLRIKIKQNKLSGYYIKHNDDMIPIDCNGRLEWPGGLFELFGNQLAQLIS